MRNIKKFRAKTWRGGLFLLVIGIAFSIIAPPGLAKFDWTKYKGTEVTVYSYAHDYQKVAASYLHEFEAKTGIKVAWQVMGAWDLRAKAARELVAGMPSFDAWFYEPGQQEPWLSKGNYMVDQMKFIEDPELTAPDWDFDDFSIVGKKSNRGIIEHTPFSLGLTSATRGVGYRKDLFEKYGLTAPQTFEELEEVAKKLTLDTNGDGKIDIYGYVARGKGMQAVPSFSAYLYGYGGAWWTNDGRSAINKPETIRAVKEYARMLRTYGPPSPGELGWLESIRVFTAGKAATIISATDQIARSEIVGKVGWTALPAGPAGRHVYSELLCFGIPREGKKKEATWFFIQWLASKEMQFRALQEAQVSVLRLSAWQNPAYKPINEEISKCLIKSLEMGREWNYTTCLSLQKVREIWGEVIDIAMEGRPVEERANEAAKEIEATLKETNDDPTKYVDPASLYMPKNVYRVW